jgi:GAF domain-containing protein
MSEYPDGFAALVVALNSSLVHEENLSDTLHRVAYLACESAIGADHAGVTLQRGETPATAAFHGDAALPLDEAQYEADDGPCLDAYRTGTMHALGSIADEADRWPMFAKRAEELGIVSSFSLPLVLRDEKVGALNLYSSRPLTFTEERVHLATLFAQQAALAVTNAEVYFKTYTLTQNLQVALENRDRIGQAKGVLANSLGITMDEAFELLRKTSQHMNVKLRDIADHVATTGQLPTSPL